MPQSWAEDQDRRQAAGIPATVEFTTKPRQAKTMISRAIQARVPFAWFTADEVYGQAKYLQAWLEEQDVSYVLAIRRSDTLTTPAGEQRADALIAATPARSWQRISVGAGAHGLREFRWARIPVRTATRQPGRGHWLLARQSLHDLDEIACYACYGPRRSSTADLAWIAGSRWHIGGMLPAGQRRSRARSLPGPVLAGLVRPHHLVHARPGLARGQPGRGGKKGIGTSDPGMIGYTLTEIRRLLISLLQRYSPDPEGIWSWSTWRRKRQHQARLCHYRQHGIRTQLSAVAVLSVTARGNITSGTFSILFDS